MFTDHFKMTRHPFSERTPVDMLLADERVSEGLARLEYLVSEGTVGLLTGPTGAGKSALIRLLRHRLGKNQAHLVYIHMTNLENSTSFLKLVVSSLGEVPKKGKERVFLQIVEKARAIEPPTLLIIDEAHLLGANALIDLRLLVSSALEDSPPLKILLAGQQHLKNHLKQASCEDLLQRVCVRYYLPPLTKDQTVAYIDFQMQRCGASDKVFEPEVKSTIHDYSSGIPRRINNLATACLIRSASAGEQRVTEAILQSALAESEMP